jgi:hypothetical protein
LDKFKSILSFAVLEGEKRVLRSFPAQAMNGLMSTAKGTPVGYFLPHDTETPGCILWAPGPLWRRGE